jgi:diaminopimelate decarboxylase
MNGARLTRLCERYGTPLYAYDFEALERSAARLAAAVGTRFEIFYAVKANPALAVLRLFSSLGLGADVASRGELRAAIAAGFPPERIVMAGPGKSVRDLAAAAGAPVLGINVEGVAELDRLQRIAEAKRRRVPVQLRLNPGGERGEKVPILGAAASGKFGLSVPLARRVLSQRGRWPHLDFGGFHVFQASNVLDANLFVGNIGRVLDLVLGLARRYGVPLRLVDLGGGLGVPYGEGERPLDLEALRRGFRGLAREIAGETLFEGTRFVLEPGRFLAAEAGVYVCRVLDVKVRRGAVFAVVDGGIHHLLRPALMGPHPVRLVRRSRRPRPRVRVTVGGPLCTGLDVLAVGASLPEPEPGDLLAVGNAGAYGYTESLPLFLSHEWPTEVGVRGRRDALLRRPPSVSELLDAQKVPRGLVRALSSRAMIP